MKTVSLFAFLAICATLSLAYDDPSISVLNIGPFGGRVNHIALDPYDSNHYLAAVPDGGIFESKDGGESWTLSNSGLSDLRAATVTFDPLSPGVVFALTGGGLFNRTGDGNWTLVSDQLSASGTDYPLIFNGKDVLVATPDHVGYSKDGGLTWNVTPNPANPHTSKSISAVYFNDSIYMITSSGLYVSKDRAGSWEKIPSLDSYPIVMGGDFDSIAMDVGNDGTIYLVKNTGYLLKSEDGGATWQNITYPNISYSLRSIKVNPENPEELYLGGAYEGIDYSDDGGATWHNVLEENNFSVSEPATDIRSMTMDWVHGILYVASDRGVYTFDAATKKFTFMNNGLTNIQVYGMSVGGSGDLYLATQDTALFTDHPGSAGYRNDWVNDSSGGDVYQALEAKNPFYYWSRGGSIDHVFRGRLGTGGYDYTSYPVGFSGDPSDLGRQSIVYDSSGNLYAASNNGTYKTSDEGATPFVQLNSKESDNLFFDEIGGKLYATTIPYGYQPTTGTELYSIDTDTGATASIKTFDSSITTFAVSGSHMLVGTLDGVYTSNDSGSTWQAAALPTDGIKIVSIDPYSPNRYLVAFSSNFPLYGPMKGEGLYKSDDHGQTWQQMSNGDLDANPITGMVFSPDSPDVFYVSTYSRGVFEVAIGSALSDCTTITAPGGYYLTQDLNGSPEHGALENACILIANVSNVALDCMDHRLSEGQPYTGDVGVLVEKSSDVSINGCKFSDYSDSVIIRNSQNVRVDSSTVGPKTVPGFSDGLVAVVSNNVTFADNEIDGAGYCNFGMELGYSPYVSLIGNNVRNCQDGLYSSSSPNISSIENSYINNTYGVDLRSSSDGRYVRDNASGNSAYGFWIIGGSDGNKLTDTITDSNGIDGIHIENSTGNNIDPPESCYNINNGLTILNADATHVSGLLACWNGNAGIGIINSTDTLVASSILMNNLYGVQFDSHITLLDTVLSNDTYINNTIRDISELDDSDGDGVLDGSDQCPSTPGQPAFNGCPGAIRCVVKTARDKPVNGSACFAYNMTVPCLLKSLPDFLFAGKKRPSCDAVSSCITSYDGRCVMGVETPALYIASADYGPGLESHPVGNVTSENSPKQAVFVFR